MIRFGVKRLNIAVRKSRTEKSREFEKSIREIKRIRIEKAREFEESSAEEKGRGREVGREGVRSRQRDAESGDMIRCKETPRGIGQDLQIQ